MFSFQGLGHAQLWGWGWNYPTYHTMRHHSWFPNFLSKSYNQKVSCQDHVTSTFQRNELLELYLNVYLYKGSKCDWTTSMCFLETIEVIVWHITQRSFNIRAYTTNFCWSVIPRKLLIRQMDSSNANNVDHSVACLALAVRDLQNEIHPTSCR